MEPLKTKDQLLREIMKMHDRYISLKIKLANYKVYMFMIYGLTLGLFGLMMVIMIMKTFS